MSAPKGSIWTHVLSSTSSDWGDHHFTLTLDFQIPENAPDLWISRSMSAEVSPLLMTEAWLFANGDSSPSSETRRQTNWPSNRFCTIPFRISATPSCSLSYLFQKIDLPSFCFLKCQFWQGKTMSRSKIVLVVPVCIREEGRRGE